MKASKVFRSFRNFLKDPFFKFFLILALYILWVQWMDEQLLLLGIIILADMRFTQFVNWRFWRKRNPAGSKYKVSTEIIDSVIIAVLIALFLRIFFFEAFTVPTASMDKTLIEGDYILVNKFKFGPRLPMTPLNFPFTHNTMPFGSSKNSFSAKPSFHYKRLNGYTTIKNNDIVVFNFPVGDTVLAGSDKDNYYQLVRKYGREHVKKEYALNYRPVDKRNYYTKRVVAIAGDSLQIIHGKTWVNHKAEPEIAGSQHNYLVKARGNREDTLNMLQLGVSLPEVQYNEFNSIYTLPLTRQMYLSLIDSGYFKAIVPYESTDPIPSEIKHQIFPHSAFFPWTEDNYGPVYVPEQGKTIELNTLNLPLYQRIITAYEGNSLQIRNDSIYINEILSTSYTFRMNYYFMLGDNRHNSRDSRYWGFVPENHIIGKAVLIWLSVDKSQPFYKGIRWKRVMQRIR